MTKDTEALREALAKCRHQFQSYATEHKAKSDAAYKAWDDARYWGNVDEQDAAHKEYHKRLTQTQTNEALVAMIDAALDPDTIGSHFGNGGGFDPSAELGFDPTAEVGDEVFPHDAGESAPVAWMLRSNETGEVIFDEVCVWRDRESAEDAVAEIDPELMEYSADAVPFPLYAHPPHPAPVDPDPDFREYVRKAGERLAPHSGDAPGTPTRDALVWINAALHPIARSYVPLDLPIAPNIQTAPVDPVAGGEALREGPAPIPNTRMQCFGCKHLDTKYWREPSGDGETFDSGTSARCKAIPTEHGGQSISAYWSRSDAAPKWCPFLAALKGPAA